MVKLCSTPSSDPSKKAARPLQLAPGPSVPVMVTSLQELSLVSLHSFQAKVSDMPIAKFGNLLDPIPRPE
jgi:hypothetical protein